MTEKTCVTNDGYVQAAEYQADAIMTQMQVEVAIQVGLALWQRNTSKTIAANQQEIAERQIELAEALQEHAEKFWPEEERLVNDTMDEAAPDFSPWDFATAAGDNILGLVPFAVEFVNNQTTDQCIPLEDPYARRMSNYLHREAADMSSHWAREAVHINDTRGDLRYARQYAVLQSGRGLIGEASAYMSLGGAAGVMAGGMLEGAITGITEAIGHSSARTTSGGGWGSAIRDSLVGPPPAPSNEYNEARKEGIARARQGLNHLDPRNR